ncbi:hypothetical protein CCACVL1_21233, partial [Corchorus capsularis]
EVIMAPDAAAACNFGIFYIHNIVIIIGLLYLAKL